MRNVSGLILSFPPNQKLSISNEELLQFFCNGNESCVMVSNYCTYRVPDGGQRHIVHSMKLVEIQ